ncbi:uncharacterized protein LOC106665370, partial [Cimex lectularius]|uniref:uncharacterized protein LOC106665370 n=1 Tax=Cimex lectularius TaxID=79782 RepID=UPI000CEF6AAB
LFGHTGYCAACSKVIPAFEMVMRARNNVYHLECFACQQCNHSTTVVSKVPTPQAADKPQWLIPDSQTEKLIAPGVVLHGTSSVDSGPFLRPQEPVDRTARGCLEKPPILILAKMVDAWINADALPSR